MTPRFYLIPVLIFLGLSLTACNTSAAGPQTWLDRPIDHSSHSWAPMILQAHASDAKGIAGFEFYVDEVLLSTVSANGARLGEAAIEWVPPGPGAYNIKARALDVDDNPGGYAISHITIQGDSSPGLSPSPSVDPTLEVQTLETSPTPTETIDITATSEPRPPQVTARTNANCRSGPGTVYEVLTSLVAGQNAPIEGRNQDSSWWLINPSIGGQTCWISASTVDINGDTNQIVTVPAPPLPSTPTPTPTPTPTFTLTASPTPDNTPPTISSVDVSPTDILTDGNGCASYARTTTVTAVVSDASGISSVVAYWNIGGVESGQVSLQAGTSTYSANIGPVNTVGSLEIYILVQDSAGNSAQSGTLLVSVQSCVE